MLRARLTLGLLPLLLLFFGVCLFAFVTDQRLGRDIDTIFNQNFRTIRTVAALRDAARRMDSDLDVEPTGKTEEASRNFSVDRSLFLRQLTAEMQTQPDSTRAALLNGVDDSFRRFIAAGQEVMTFHSAVSRVAAKEAYVEVNEKLNALRDHDQGEILASGLDVRTRTDDALRLVMGAMLAAVLLFFLLSWRLASAFLKPIKTVTSSAVAMGEGNLDLEVPVSSRDELGRLAVAFNTLAARLRAYREATMARVLRTQRTMEAALTSTPDPVFVLSRDRRDIVRNPAADVLACLPEFADGAFPPTLGGPLGRVLEVGEHYLPTDYSRVVTVRLHGEDRHFLPRILAIGDKLTEFKGAAVILQDVTKFRLLDDVKTNLVGTVSHELKTPLTSLRMAVYLLLEPEIGDLDPRQKELLETAREDVDRLLQMLDNLLDLARLERGVSALERTEVPVRALLDRVVDEARSFIAAAGQSIDVRAGAEVCELRVSVDVERIRHVFMNLLTNASKYSPPGGVITLAADPAPSGFVRFTVADEGPGIPEKSIPHIFDRFYRAPGQSQSGTGLGLAIAREIVVAHGGSISCHRREGPGAEFQFLLPTSG